MLVAAGLPVDTATSFVELIAASRAEAVAKMETTLRQIEAMSGRVGALATERDQYRRDFAAMADRAAELACEVTAREKDRDDYRAMVADLLASAHPHPVEHPTMTKQWEHARELLKNGPQP
jgi:hypothetical protein